MATDADNKNQNDETMSKTITSLSFRDKGPDAELIGLSNAFARRPENQGIQTTSLLRNFFVRKLKEYLDPQTVSITDRQSA